MYTEFVENTNSVPTPTKPRFNKWYGRAVLAVCTSVWVTGLALVAFGNDNNTPKRRTQVVANVTEQTAVWQPQGYEQIMLHLQLSPQCLQRVVNETVLLLYSTANPCLVDCTPDPSRNSDAFLWGGLAMFVVGFLAAGIATVLVSQKKAVEPSPA